MNIKGRMCHIAPIKQKKVNENMIMCG